MKYILPAVSLLFMLFFAIPFPMLLYYNIKSEYPPDLAGTDLWFALSLVALSIILWGILVTGYFRNWVLSVFKVKHNLEKLKKDGVHRKAEILSSTKLLDDTYELKLSFKNLSDSQIEHLTTVKDSKPFEQRFEAGKTVDVLIDREVKRFPYLTPATAEAHINKTSMVLRIAGWLTFVAALISYYIYSYEQESDGAGWRFISFGHPLIVCALVLFCYKGLAMLIKKFAEPSADVALIKFKGVRTAAKVIHVAETGVYINEQPVIRFELEYTDAQHQTHRVSLKKRIGLLSLDMTKQKHIDIFYLLEAPSRVAFAGDLN